MERALQIRKRRGEIRREFWSLRSYLLNRSEIVLQEIRRRLREEAIHQRSSRPDQGFGRHFFSEIVIASSPESFSLVRRCARKTKYPWAMGRRPSLVIRQIDQTMSFFYYLSKTLEKEKKTMIAPNQVFVPKVALKAQSHKNRFH